MTQAPSVSFAPVRPTRASSDVVAQIRAARAVRLMREHMLDFAARAQQAEEQTL